MIPMQCKYCGSSDILHHPYGVKCSYCGTVYRYENDEEKAWHESMEMESARLEAMKAQHEAQIKIEMQVNENIYRIGKILDELRNKR